MITTLTVAAVSRIQIVPYQLTFKWYLGPSFWPVDDVFIRENLDFQKIKKSNNICSDV